MEQTKYLYQDISDLLDTISLILSEQKIEEIGGTFMGCIMAFDEIKNDIDLDPESQQEQCLVAIAEAFKTHRMPDFLSIALQSIDSIDFHSMWVLAKNGSLNSQLSCPSAAISTFYNSERYKTLFFDLLNADEETINEIDSILQDACTNPDKLDAISRFVVNEHQLKDFISCLSAATIEDNFKTRYNIDNTIPPLYQIKVAKRVSYKFLDDYSEWDKVVKDKLEQLDYLEILNYYSKKFLSECSNNEITDEDKKTKMLSVYKLLTLNAFLLNWAATSDDWFDYIDHEINILCDSPVNTKQFIAFLKNHSDGILITTLYNEYCNNMAKKPKFPIELVLDITSKPQKDNDPSHLSWYEPIPKNKVKEGKDENLLIALIKLYNVLISKNYIPKTTPMKIFIYRFSGFLPAYSDSEFHKIEWNSQKNIIATIIGRLYKPDTPFAKCLNFFEPKIQNGSALYNSAKEEIKKTVRSMLSDCGFINV